MNNKLDMQTKNKAEENFQKLAAMFPNAVTETIDENGEVVRAIDKDVLMQEISCKVVEGTEERYQFTWPDKKKSVLLANAPINKTLRPCREESVDFDTTENLYIEGDNLEVLKILQETYLGKIKMIYIDPPYNTGNDFVYEDDFAQSTEDYVANSGQLDEAGNRLVQNTESNGRFHTDWLNMIYPRLKLAKDLLADDGVIFISIDDNEVSNLRRISDEVFGEDSFVTTLHVEMSATQGMKVKAAQSGNIVKNAEYIIVYSRNGRKDIASENVLYDFRPDYDDHYSKYLDDNDQILNVKDVFSSISPLSKIATLSGLYKESKVFREFVYKNIHRICADDKISGFNIADYPAGKAYRVREGDKERIIYNNGSKMRQLLLLQNSFGQCDDFSKSFGLRKIRGDWWKDFYKDMGNVTKEGEMAYTNGKKPVRLIYQLAKMCLTREDVVLDFFSGSATTAHAVVQLNAEDGGSRKFIMMQLPEKIDYSNQDNKKYYDEAQIKTLCDIGKERIRRAGKKIKEENPLTTQNLDTGFRVLKCDSSNMKDVYYNPSELSADALFDYANNIKEDRSPEDLLFQVMLDLGVLPSSKIVETTLGGKKVFSVADGFLMACFDRNVSEETITAIAKQKPYYFVMRDSSMANDSVATNFDQIFATYSPDTVRKVL